MSKRVIVTGLVLGLLAGALVMPAEAAKKKKPAAPAPVPTVMYLEGSADTGEEDAGVPVVASGEYLQLTKAPGTGEKSMGIYSYSAGPNNKCAGNSLFPVFQGAFAGTITGDLKVTFEAMGTPGSKVEVRVWPDLGATPEAPICNDAYIEPAGAVEVPLPSSRGPVEAVIPGLNVTAGTNLVIQLTAVAGSATAPTVPPFVGRAYYGLDTTKVEFSCLPASGAASCLP